MSGERHLPFPFGLLGGGSHAGTDGGETRLETEAPREPAQSTSLGCPSFQCVCSAEGPRALAGDRRWLRPGDWPWARKGLWRRPRGLTPEPTAMGRDGGALSLRGRVTSQRKGWRWPWTYAWTYWERRSRVTPAMDPRKTHPGVQEGPEDSAGTRNPGRGWDDMELTSEGHLRHARSHSEGGGGAEEGS